MKEQLTHRERRLKDEWDISYILARKIDEAISNAEKYVRAEVLGACKKRLKEYEAIADEWASLSRGQAIREVRRTFDTMQPAASDLEALLREEREKFAALQMHTYELLGDLHEKEKADISDSMERVEADLRNLEKARAIVEKK